MFVKMIYFLLLSCSVANTDMAIAGQNAFFTPVPVSFPANLNEQNLQPYTGQLLDLSKRGIYCITTKIFYDDKDNPITPRLDRKSVV